MSPWLTRPNTSPCSRVCSSSAIGRTYSSSREIEERDVSLREKVEATDAEYRHSASGNLLHLPLPPGAEAVALGGAHAFADAAGRDVGFVEERGVEVVEAFELLPHDLRADEALDGADVIDFFR